MPELPEVETTCRGIAPYVIGETIIDVIVRNRQLRWPVPHGLNRKLVNHSIKKLERRAKYILFMFEHGCLIMHLGMSGSLRIIKDDTPPQKHDHIDIVFGSGIRLRFRDPRRFGSLHWTKDDPLTHKLLAHLGPEPLNEEFNGDYLYQQSRGRKQAIKTFIMDSRMVVGVGNIYASEALYLSGILPTRQAGKLSKVRCAKLTTAIKDILEKSIKAGGTTLRDFTSGEGQPGYFSQELKVYGKEGESCENCGNPIRQARIGQRSTYYCGKCQR